ncbi:hypothetical protein, partial [Marinomonas sp.]|uniref:hypothetical protein n=1 Tax=Marinomonas sp. TaxID=1904862 RepID=UPI003C785CA3
GFSTPKNQPLFRLIQPCLAFIIRNDKDLSEKAHLFANSIIKSIYISNSAIFIQIIGPIIDSKPLL